MDVVERSDSHFARLTSGDGQAACSALASLDGYAEDTGGQVRWAEPDEEVHAFVNDLMRRVGTHPYGRRMYETMLFW